MSYINFHGDLNSTILKPGALFFFAVLTGIPDGAAGYSGTHDVVMQEMYLGFNAKQKTGIWIR